jgi:2-polyprenyl-6-hydroxyphenyl methylase/3-demethylubiquinone-9 3-methyltransferase
MAKNDDLYQGRFLSQGYPNLEKLVSEKSKQKEFSSAKEIMSCIGRLVDLKNGVNTIVDVGCGPHATNVKTLLDAHYNVVGVEPVTYFVESARNMIGDPNRIVQGCAESLPFNDQSQRVVLMQNVLEHVDSVPKCLEEAYRVLAPDGVLYVSTTNKLSVCHAPLFSEFNIPFYSLFPSLVKECYVYKQLHFDPGLANFTLRPAVHWFTYSGLCKMGRDAGFARFYSKIDLVDLSSDYVKRGPLRRMALKLARWSPWFRALVLSQTGHIIMWKRME